MRARHCIYEGVGADLEGQGREDGTGEVSPTFRKKQHGWLWMCPTTLVFNPSIALSFPFWEAPK